MLWVGLLGCFGTTAAQQPVPLSLEQHASRAIRQHAMLELRMQPSPTPDDYRIAYLTLSLAKDLTPDDPDLARMIAAAAWATGDSDLLVAATRELVRLDPADTVAQLRLITATIAQLQTADARLRAYERFLGPAAQSIDVSVRSRLAVDAALLYREQGQDDRFVEHVSLALALDATNKSAAQLALTYFTNQTTDPVGTFELHLNLLYADPLDPNVHHALAVELAHHGALEQCLRFHQHSIRLATLESRFDEALELESLALGWPLRGPEVVLESLESRLAQDRRQAAERRAAAIEQDLPLDDVVEPKDVRLSPDKDKLRILLGMALNRPEIVQAALSDLTNSIFYAGERASNPATRPEGMTEEQAIGVIAGLLVDLQLYRLWANLEREQVDADLLTLRERATGDVDLLLDPLQPWILLRDGKPQEAIDFAQRIGERGGRLAKIATAMAMIELGQTADAAAILREESRPIALSAIGAWCRHTALQLDDKTRIMSDVAPAIASLADDVPRFIDDMIENPSTFMSLRIETAHRSLNATDPFAVKLRLRNLAPIPLGVGSDRPINSRVLLQPHRDNNMAFFAGVLFPEVIELDRRLRLGYLESIEVEVPVDLGATGYIMSLNMLGNHRMRWRALQGFRIGRLGSFVSGPLCLSAETFAVECLMAPERALLRNVEVDVLTVRIRTAPVAEMPRYAQLVRSLLLAWPDPTQRRPDRLAAVLAETLTLRMRDKEPLEKLILASVMPHQLMDDAMARFDEVALFVPQEEDARSRPHAAATEAMVLLTRVRSVEDPFFAFAATSDDRRVSELATLVKRRLEEDRPCIARASHPSQILPLALRRSNP
jgi:hypothetical protein